MSRFAERSSQTELIDEENIPFSDWATCLHELNTVNTLLGGHAITVDGVKSLLRGKTNERIIIAEIGCGGGDNLKAIHRWNRDRYPLSYIGIDINEACTTFAKKNCSVLPSAQFITSDYKAVEFNQNKPDIIFNSLFCHHFSNQELVDMLQWMSLNSNYGFFINDLQRHPVAYHSIRLLTKIFSKSYLVKNDGPISVLRGFHRNEWETLLSGAGIKHFSIHWRWTFRYLVLVENERRTKI
jgi:2-polyprenyl-3-methyl-5-hydroxy-6-metoxy-1,4-benzoquinol methylase